MSDVKLRQVRSSNGASPKQRGTRESTMKDTPQLRGALDRVSHLVDEVKD